MSISPYTPVGRCIYCGVEGYSESCTKLATEHVIPRALQGSLELPEASCQACERITGRNEQLALRGLYRGLRHRLDFRHRKKQPEELPVFIEVAGDADQRVMVPISEYPDISFFINLEPPARLRGIPAGAEYGPVHRYFRLRACPNPAPWNGLISFCTPSLDLFSFCRMLAKIGHSYVVAELGIRNFKPLLLDVILNEARDIFHYVGGSRNTPLLRLLNKDVAVSMDCTTIAETTFIVVHLRLFATVDASPVYRIVVGETLKHSQSPLTSAARPFLRQRSALTNT
jgi:hypothetical protein